MLLSSLVFTCSLLVELFLVDACVKEFVQYFPSPFEQDWVANIASYENKMCEVITSRNIQKKRFQAWYEIADGIEKEFRENKTCGNMWSSADHNEEIFSRMEYKFVCPKAKHPLNDFYFNESIEPLAGFIRDSRPVCSKHSAVKLESKNYIMFSNWNCQPGQNKVKLRSPRLIIADLGSTTFMYSLSGPSQSFLYSKYKTLGYTNLQRFLAWEARPYPKTQGYFDQVPVEVMPHYQFYNVKINAEEGGRYNPLTHIKGIAKPRDFVSLKLDVDNSDIEFSLINQIISNPSIYNLIDEFFFEHHSTVKEFRWAWKDQVRGSMSDGYKFFTKLRELGIRAHSWI